VRLENEADIANCKANPGGVRALLATLQANGAPKGIYVYWAGVETSEKEDETQLRVHARMFFTDPGEDSATGSAAIA
jgi:predicted PhzF superfamily epimerase YddE/YHI9